MEHQNNPDLFRSVLQVYNELIIFISKPNHIGRERHTNGCPLEDLLVPLAVIAWWILLKPYLMYSLNRHENEINKDIINLNGWVVLQVE